MQAGGKIDIIVELMTKDDLQQIGELIDNKLEPINIKVDGLEHGSAKLEKGQARLTTDVERIKTDVGHISTAMDALKAGQDDIRDKMATKADVMDLGAKIDRVTKNHERRIEELEEHAGLKNPYKN